MDFKEHKISSPQGLMIDNWVYNRHGEAVPFRSRDFMAFQHPDMGGFYGFYAIPLTEEWLIKMGYERRGPIWFHPTTVLHEIWNRAKLGGEHYIAGRMEPDYFLGISEQIKYVHQLQNLYLSLTGKELEIK